jgi:MFS family permease
LNRPAEVTRRFGLMNVHRTAVNRAAVAALILGRIFYAVNWYSLAAVFSFTASELHQNVSGLGIVTAAFFVGIGVSQVPGGILAAKIGPRLTVIFGTAVASSAALLTGFAADLAEIAVLRFFVGLGMAFVFAPGVILMAKLIQEGSEGLGVGFYNSAFSLGGALGLFGWAVLAAQIGWRSSLAIGGLLGIFTSILMWFLVPKDSQRSDFTVELHHLRLILLDKWLIILSVAMLGLQAGSTVFSNFMAYYLESAVSINVGEAGTIASLASLFAFASAPFAGRLFDRHSNTKQLLLASGCLMAVGVGVAFLGTVYSAILAGVLVGLATGSGFTFGFSAAREANKLDKEYETLAVSWVNSISLFGNFVSPLLFSYVVIQYGYSPAWLCMAVLAFVLIIPILFPKVSRQKQAHGEK